MSLANVKHGSARQKSTDLKGLIQRIHHDRRGNILLLTVIAVPTLLITMFGGVSVMMALAQKQELVSVAQSACNRAVKPQRAVILEDSDRQALGEKSFDALATGRKFKVTSRTVEAGWLTANVKAKATVPVMPGLGLKLDLPISVDTTCKGIPPYPALGDVILSSNFVKPDGGPVVMTNTTWGLYHPKILGWDGGTGYAVEIQDWTGGWKTNPIQYLPPGVSSNFVVELDSGSNDQDGGVVGAKGIIGQDLDGLSRVAPPSTCGWGRNTNSSMYKTLELHPGTYRFSLWYRARNFGTKETDFDTNTIEVTMEGVRPVSQEVVKLTIDNRVEKKWEYHYFDIPVDSYGIYKFGVRAAGCGDTAGGLFNDLKLTYIQRPYPEYNDPAPSPPPSTGPSS